MAIISRRRSRRVTPSLVPTINGAPTASILRHFLRETLRQSTAVFLSGDLGAARALASEKEAFRRLDDQATAAHFDRLRSGNIKTAETSALHLDALRDLKRVASHLIEASAYPILKKRGDLLPTRLRTVE